MAAKNIIVYSPNDIFNDYISDVLPKLGEENMQMSTFMKLAETYLGRKHRFQDYYTQMEGILTKSPAISKEAIREKGSGEFADAINMFVENLKTRDYDFKDIVYGENALAYKSELEALFYRDYSMHPVSTRLEKIHTLLDKRLVYLTRKIRKNYVEVAKQDHGEGKKAAYIARSIIEELRKQAYYITHPDPFYLYLRFLKESNKNKYYTRYKKSLDENNVRYEDCAPVMWLKLLLGYSRDFEEIKHLIVDEVQDYSHIEMMVFFKLFKNIPMTLLGDTNQAINYLTDTNNLKSSAIGESYTVKLEKSYRSTRQISKFCNILIGKEIGYEYVDRDGAEPYVSQFSGNGIYEITEMIKKYKTERNTSIAVITKTAESAGDLHVLIGSEDIKLIKKSDDNFTLGTVILPSYLAKGLEFDAVIVVDTIKEHFNGDEDRKLFYTCCSRALHDLSILYEKNCPYGADEF